MTHSSSINVFAVLEGKLLVCGGENTVGDLLDQIQEYDPEAKKWTNKGVLPQPLKSECRMQCSVGYPCAYPWAHSCLLESIPASQCQNWPPN